MNVNISKDEVQNILVNAIAVEAGLPPEQLATDQPFTSYGLDSMAALAVGMEIEDNCGLSDLPVSLMWDHPTVDTLTSALWELMHGESVPAAVDEKA